MGTAGEGFSDDDVGGHGRSIEQIEFTALWLKTR
jgi:hypothetical protein